MKSSVKKCAGSKKCDVTPIYRVTWPGSEVETHDGQLVGHTERTVKSYCFACAIRAYDAKDLEGAKIVREI